MSEYERQHYVPNGILKNFGIKKPNGNYEVCLIDLFNSKVEYRNTQRAMYARNIYDITDEDVKALEKKFSTKIEEPMFKIVDRLLKNVNIILLTREELMIIKKYMLIQIFRSLRNMTGYIAPPEGVKELSSYNIQEGESKLDFWKREMTTIIDSDWDSLVNSTDLVSVKSFAQTIHTGFLIFFKTEEEFIINDSGIVSERFFIEIPEEEHDAFIKYMNEIVEERFGTDGFGRIVKDPLQKGKMHIDSGLWMPLSSNLAVVNVHLLLKIYLTDSQIIDELPIPLACSKLFGFLSHPENIYVNQKAIDADLEKMINKYSGEIGKLPARKATFFKNSLLRATIIKNKSDDDQYLYEVQELGPYHTMEWNLSVMNETHQYLCFKTPAKVIPVIQEYNQQKADGEENMKKDYTGYDNLLKNLKRS